ncbi:MAG: T9SS type A sorting domain-containing protein [Bacteroidales bacterium]
MKPHNKLLFILLLLSASFSVCSQDTVDATTLNNKIMAGYQGWFAANGDGSGYGWIHWSRRGEVPNADNITIDMWPDMREYDEDELFKTSFVYPDFTQAGLYSAYTKKTVERHVKWMKDYGIDGVFVQRFLGSTASRRNLRDTVLQNVRYGAEKYGRAFANMYDLSGGNTETLVEWIKNDWMHLVDDLKILESPNYLHHNGKPVLSIWGFGLSGRPGTPMEAEEIIRWLTEEAPEKYKVTLKGGVDDKWQDHSSEWQSVYEMFDILSPWAVGRYGDIAGADNFRKNKIEPDLIRTQGKNIDYIPVVFPGFSWYNLKEGTSELNRRPRIGGNFFWHQLYNAVDAGCNMVYVAMYDEVDEGTAIFKLAENEQQIPTTGKFVTLDIDGYKLPSDWYLRLTGEATKMLRGEINLTSTIPIVAYPDRSEFISQQVPTIMAPGATSTISVTLKNTGITNWTKSNNYKLIYSVDSTQNTWGIAQVELEESEIIEPGELKTFVFEITAPSMEGVYPFQWSLFQQGKGWIDDASELQLINVSSNPAFLDDCDAIGGWTSSGSLSLNTSENKQGTGCIEFLGSGSDTTEFKQVFLVPYNSGIESFDATLQFWYYISDASLAPNGITVNLGSEGSPDNNFYEWTEGNLINGWNLITLNISDAAISGTPDLAAINWFRISSEKAAPLSSKIDEIQLFDRYSGRIKYELIVNNGEGSGQYAEDVFVSIIADETPIGSVFTRWRVVEGNPLFEDVNAPETNVRIRDMNVELTAEYKMFGQYLDDCDGMNGWGSSGPITLNTSDYKEGSGCIEFSGNQTDEFKKSFETPHNPGVSAERGRLEFWYYVSNASRLGSNNQLELGSAGRSDQQEYNWNLSGLNDGWNFISVKFSNASITNSAPDLSAINWFRIYNFKSGSIVSRIDAIEITDPDAGVKYPLSVQNGTGDGSFYQGSNISIVANPAPSGYLFEQWSIESGSPVISDIHAANTTLTMGNGPAVILASFLEEHYPLTVQNGTGDGNYTPGTIVTIQADQATEGHSFDQWIIESGNPVISDIHASSTTLTMGNVLASVSATFIEDVTGIFLNGSLQKVHIFPNPGTNEFSVALSLETTANISISLQDLSGRILENMVMNQQILPGNQVINLPVSGIEPGTYILRISIDDTLSTRMVIIN